MNATGTEAILQERGERYGNFAEHAVISQTLKGIIKYRMGAKWDLLHADQKEALEMVCHKLARIVNGDPNYADSWCDIAGYAQLVANRLEQAQWDAIKSKGSDWNGKDSEPEPQLTPEQRMAMEDPVGYLAMKGKEKAAQSTTLEDGSVLTASKPEWTGQSWMTSEDASKPVESMTYPGAWTERDPK